MKLLLDTDVCIAILNRDERIQPHLERHSPSELRMSAITLAELRFGVAKSAQPKTRVLMVEAGDVVGRHQVPRVPRVEPEARRAARLWTKRRAGRLKVL